MSKVRDEACAHETILNEPATIRGNWRRIDKLVTRYRAEAAVVAIALLLWAPRLSGPIDLRWDGGVYYLLGTSLATGHGYRVLSEPGSPEALQYPPLLPAVVAVHEWALGTTNPDAVGAWLRKLYFVIFVAYAFAVFALAKRHLRLWLALAATTLCLLHLYTVFLSDLLFAELPFALVSVVFALVAASGPLASRPRLRETMSFALAAAGFLLRTAGVVLFAAWVIEALIRRRWRLALARGALALMPIALWQAHVERVRTSDEYARPAYEYQRAPYQYYNVAYAENILLLDPFHPERGPADRRALVTRLVTNFTKMPAALGEAVSTTNEFWRRFLQRAQHRLPGRAVIPLRVVSVPIFGFAALVVAGLIVLIRRGAWLMVFILLGSVGLTCTTPWPRQFARYLSPLAPFLTIAAVLALSRVRAVLRAPELGWVTTLGRVALASILLLTVAVQADAALWLFGGRARGDGATFVPEGRSVGARFFYHDRSWRAWEEAVAWIDAHAPPDAIVATNAPHFCYLRTGRRAVLPPMEADPARARRLLEAVPVSHVIIDELEFLDVSRRYARPAVEGDPVAWHLVHSVKRTQIYARATGP